MSSAFKSLPIIDISGPYAGSIEERRKVADEIGAAARDSGFFHIKRNPISRAVRERLLKTTIAFFELSSFGQEAQHRKVS